MADQQSPSLGGQFDAWFRQGLKDLQSNLGTAFPQTDRSVTEPGTPGNPTPQMVTEALDPEHGAMLDNYAARGRGQEQQQEQGMER